jgi:hypothetical protein
MHPFHSLLIQSFKLTFHMTRHSAIAERVTTDGSERKWLHNKTRFCSSTSLSPPFLLSDERNGFFGSRCHIERGRKLAKITYFGFCVAILIWWHCRTKRRDCLPSYRNNKEPNETRTALWRQPSHLFKTLKPV